MPRFVVQQHFRQPDDWHYDLMLECGGALVTFSSSAAPDDVAALPCLVQQLPNHRLAYLEYEGEISGGRGWCRIHDCGTLEWLEPPPSDITPAQSGQMHFELIDQVVVHLEGQKARGTYRLTRETKSGADYWRLRKENCDAPR